MSNKWESDMQVRFDCILRSDTDKQTYLNSFQTGEKAPKHRLPDEIKYPCIPVVNEIRSGTSYSHEFLALSDVLSSFTPDEVLACCADISGFGVDRVEDSPAKAHKIPRGGKAPSGAGKVQAHLAICVARKPLEVQRLMTLWDGKDAISIPHVHFQGDFSGVGQSLQDAVNRTLQAAADDPGSSEVSHAVDDS